MLNLKLRISAVLILASTAATATAQSRPDTRIEAGLVPGTLTVFAAASLQDSLATANAEFEKQAGIPISTSFAGSAELARQIAAGAPAQIFISASPQWVDFLERQHLLAARFELLANSLVVIVPDDPPVAIHQPADLNSPGIKRLALADPDSVPAGFYAKQALSRLGLWEPLRSKVVAGADVRQALLFVERGEAQAGIVYATDALASRHVRTALELDESLSDPIRYPMVLLKNAEANREAQAYFEYLKSPIAREVFLRHGFRMTDTPATSARPAAAPPPTIEQEWSALRLSLWVAAWATVLSLPPAVTIAYWLARSKSRLRLCVEVAVNLPLVLPPVVTGYLILVALGQRGPIGRMLEHWLGWNVVFTWQGAALAAAAVGFPLMVRAIRLPFEHVDPRLEAAARTLGRNRLNAFLTVSLPLASRGVITGCMLAFARGLGEFGATIIVSGNIEGQTRTLPLAIYSLLNQPDGVARAAKLVILCVALSAAALIICEIVERREHRRDVA